MELSWFLAPCVSEADLEVLLLLPFPVYVTIPIGYIFLSLLVCHGLYF